MRVAVVTAALCFAACSSKSTSESDKTKTESPPTPVVSDAAAVATPASTDGGLPMISTAPKEVYPADKLDPFMTGVTFLGWSADSELYAVRANRGSDMGALGGEAAATTVEVYHARTNRLVALFRHSSALKDAEKKDPIRKSWEAAKPKEEWDAYAAKHRITEMAPSTKNKQWKVTAKPVNNGIAKISTLTATTSDTATAIKWVIFPEANEDEEVYFEKLGALGDDDPVRTMHPMFNLGIEGNGQAWRTVRLRVPFDLEELGERQPSGADGSLGYYWSPKGDRFVIVADWQAHGMHEEVGGDSLAAFYARTAGPQIKVVSNEHEGPTLRHHIEKAGFPVTVEEVKKDVATDQIKIYYRGAEAKTIAEELAVPLDTVTPDGGTTVEALTKPGWIHIIVFGG